MDGGAHVCRDSGIRAELVHSALHTQMCSCNVLVAPAVATADSDQVLWESYCCAASCDQQLSAAGCLCCWSRRGETWHCKFLLPLR